MIQKGYDPKIIGAFTVAYYGGSFSGKTVVGRLVDKFGNKNIFIICEILMALCIVAIVSAQSLIVIIVLSVILGSLTRGTVPASLSILIGTLDKHGRYEKGLALNTLIITVASTLGPIVLGTVSDHFGINTAFYTSASISLLAIVPIFLLIKIDNKAKNTP